VSLMRRDSTQRPCAWRSAGLTLAVFVCAAATAGAQVRPPVIANAAPYGIQRGTTTTITVDGTNLGNADAVLFSDPGLTAKILSFADFGRDVPVRRPEDTGAPISDQAQKTVVTLEVTAAREVPLGRQVLRLRTPLGTSTAVALWVGDLLEARELEPNDRAAQADTVAAPVTVNGAIFTDGDEDTFRFTARAGRQVVLRALAVGLGSRLDPSLVLLDATGAVLATNDDFGETREPLIVYTPAADGTFLVRVSDSLNTGSPRHVYRLTVGEVPYLTSVYPLGRRKGSPRLVRVNGANLGAEAQGVVGASLPDSPDLAPVEVATPAGEPMNRVQIAVGRYPESDEIEAGRHLAGAQAVRLPVTVNGRLHHTDGTPDEDSFRFTAARGQQVIISVAANQLGSPLDSVIDVVDTRGREVPRAVLRPVWETSIDLRNQNSSSSGIRLLAWSALHRGDWVYVDRELLRVSELPKGPDEDVSFTSFRGRRVAFEDTSSEAHALGRPVYKVERHPPGATFSPNGLPLFTLTYRNDDGGPMWGKDSRLTFTAPAAGDYIVRVRDARGESGPLYAYRLTLAPPRPDFDLFVSPANPNVPRGGRIPVTVTAYRGDGFDGAIEVGAEDLPPGVSAESGVILPGHSSVAITLTATADAAAGTAPLAVTGRAAIGSQPVVRQARADEKVSVLSVAAPPDVRVVSIEPAVIELAPGGHARVRATIARENGFKGRVPLSVLNLPFRVTVPDIGLNGILITEAQDSREFEIVADENAAPAEQTLFVTARVETNQVASPEQASVPIRLKITARQGTH
jgi:hypothetical protein